MASRRRRSSSSSSSRSSRRSSSSSGSDAAVASTGASAAAVPLKSGFRLTTPGLVTLIGYALLVVLVLLPFDMYVWDPEQQKLVRRPYSVGSRVLLALLLLFPYLLSVYSVNCIVTGNCVLWAWVLGGLTLLWSALITVFALCSGAFSLDAIV